MGAVEEESVPGRDNCAKLKQKNGVTILARNQHSSANHHDFGIGANGLIEDRAKLDLFPIAHVREVFLRVPRVFGSLDPGFTGLIIATLVGPRSC
jgi:hypothetical protein